MATVRIPRKVTPSQLAAVFAGLVSPRFVSVVYTSKASGPKLTPETARHTLRVGVTSAGVARVNLARVSSLLPTLEGVDLEAGLALCESYRETIAARREGRAHKGHTRAGTYEKVARGILYHPDSDTFRLVGLAHSKVVIGEPATYRDVKSKPLTIAKRKLEKLAKVSTYRELVLSGEQVTSVKAEGEAWELVGE